MTHGHRRTAIDTTRVGLSFIEVLFALVVARALDPLAKYSSIPGVGISHLAVAFVLTVTSWIGYHNSWNRPRYFIRFANLPLWQFLIDVLLVVAYWFCARIRRGHRHGSRPTRIRSARGHPRRHQLRPLLSLGLDRLRHPQVRLVPK